MEDNNFGLLSFIAGVILLGIFFTKVFFHAVIIQKWETIEGEILEYYVNYHDGRDLDSSGWHEKIRYSYFVNGHLYENDKLSKNMPMLYPSEKSVPVNKRFWKGAKVKVSYNPDNPRDSLIDRDFGVGSLISGILGIVAIAIAYNTYY